MSRTAYGQGGFRAQHGTDVVAAPVLLPLCRWYKHRSSACRDFEVGGEACLAWRGEIVRTR